MYRGVAWHDGVGAGVAASVAAGVDRRAGAALRLLPERNDDPGGRSAGDDEAADGSADPHRDERASVPLRDVSADPDCDPEGCGRDGEGWEVAMTEMLNKELLAQVVRQGRRRADRQLLSFFGARDRREGGERRRSSPYASNGPVRPDLARLVADHPRDNTASVKLGKVEMGQGTPTALLMIAAEELDMGLDADEDDHARHERHPEPGRQHRQSGRADGRQADPGSSRHGEDDAAEAGLDEPRRAGREPHRRQGRRVGRRQDRHLRRADRRQALQHDDHRPSRRRATPRRRRRPWRARRGRSRSASTSSSARARRASTSR